jgi:hypothetical protein
VFTILSQNDRRYDDGVAVGVVAEGVDVVGVSGVRIVDVGVAVGVRVAVVEAELAPSTGMANS